MDFNRGSAQASAVGINSERPTTQVASPAGSKVRSGHRAQRVWIPNIIPFHFCSEIMLLADAKPRGIAVNVVGWGDFRTLLNSVLLCLC